MVAETSSLAHSGNRHWHDEAPHRIDYQKWSSQPIIAELLKHFGEKAFIAQITVDDMPTLWASAAQAIALFSYVRRSITAPYCMLYDLTVIDERLRNHREGQPASDFTVVYHLLSIERNSFLRVKIALRE